MSQTPAHWLIKSEPVKYSFADLQRDGSTIWDGVRNNQAALYLKAMKIGDLALDRKSTRLNSSHVSISYAVFCLKKKKICASMTNLFPIPMNKSRRSRTPADS